MLYVRTLNKVSKVIFLQSQLNFNILNIIVLPIKMIIHRYIVRVMLI